MRTPEELELSLSVCSDADFGCSKCLYNAKSPINGYYGNECLTELLTDTLAYIKQLKEENRKLKRRLNALYGEKDDPSGLEKLVSKVGPITISNPNAKKDRSNGFIKLTQKDGRFIFVNATEIKAVYEYRGSTMINAGMDFPFPVEETVDEVMDKIKEA